MITPELTKLIENHLADVVEQQRTHNLEEAELCRRQKELDVRSQELRVDLEKWREKKAVWAQHVEALRTVRQFPQAMNELCERSETAATAETHV